MQVSEATKKEALNSLRATLEQIPGVQVSGFGEALRITIAAASINELAERISTIAPIILETRQRIMWA